MSNMDQRGLYPPIQPFRTRFFPVSDVHEIYFEESGNPNGKPAVFLHGGPGGGTDPKMRTFFDPAAYRIGVFDPLASREDRATGKSGRRANLVDNPPWPVVEGVEELGEHLRIGHFQEFAGSWGSTLALAY